MNIVTICSSNGEWPVHLKRWLRFVKKSNPSALLYLIWIGDTSLLHQPTFKEFKNIKIYGMENLTRKFLNSVRMESTSLFNLEDVIYCDCDCDIVEDLSGFKTKDDEIGYCRSTGCRSSWIQFHMDKFGSIPEVEANNGLLYLGSYYKQEYEGCWDEMGDSYPDRVRGTGAFNLLLKKIKGTELDYHYSVIWSDGQNWVKAKSIQYCNSEGQKKRLYLERLYDATKEGEIK